jgi:hypothetical protein
METKVRIGKKERTLQKMWDEIYDPKKTSLYELVKECFVWGLKYKHANQNGDFSSVLGLFGTASKGVGNFVPKKQNNGKVIWTTPKQQETVKLAGGGLGSELKAIFKKKGLGEEESSPKED